MPLNLDLWAKRLGDELSNKVTDDFLELLLKGMDLAFSASKNKMVSVFSDKFEGYWKNIEDFKGGYLFRTADDKVAASAIFNNGGMEVKDDGIDDWDVRVTFKDSASLREFLFSKDQDILNSILANTVEVDGNLNYIYKFGFMARDIKRRIGLE